jgi:hypothetical protein
MSNVYSLAFARNAKRVEALVAQVEPFPDEPPRQLSDALRWLEFASAEMSGLVERVECKSVKDQLALQAATTARLVTDLTERLRLSRSSREP